MATKTTWTDSNVNDFVDSFIDKEETKQDSFSLAIANALADYYFRK
jgi:hypothetical protein